MKKTDQHVSRRVLFAGAGTAGFLAVAAGLSAKAPAVSEALETEIKPAPSRGGGYSLSEHVKHYYRTTRL